MTLVITYEGAPLEFDVPPTKINMPQRAELGSVSMGGISPEDPTASLALVGHRPIHIEETTCTTQPRLFTGWTVERNIGRSFDQSQFVGPDPSIADTTIVDLNAAFGFRIITWTDGVRGEESVDDRLAWLLSSNYLAGPDGELVGDTGKVKTGFTALMDACDYREKYPADVLADLSTRYATVINYFAYWDYAPVSGHGAPRPGLFFDYISEGTFDCAISISNLIADTYAGDVPSTTCFAPITESRLERTPEAVYSDVIVNYANGSCYRILAATATAYIKRGTSISRPHIGKLSTAQAAGDAWLVQHSVETDRITTTIHVPASQVGKIQAGMRMDVKFSHLVDYTSFTSMRIVACTPRPTDDLARYYDVDLELVSPKVTPTTPVYDYLVIHRGHFWQCLDTPYETDGSQIGGWQNRADDNGWGAPHTGPVTEVPWPNITGSCQWMGFEVLSDGVYDLEAYCGWSGVSFGWSTTRVCIRQNHVIIATDTQVTYGSVSGISHPAVTGVVAAAGDIFTVDSLPTDWALFAFGSVAWTWTGSSFAITGTASESVTTGGTVPVIIHTQAAADPTVNDDIDAGYAVGSTWINTSSGEAFVLVDNTADNAVWVSTTSTGTWAPATADYLVGTAQAGLSAEIVVGATPGGELGGTWGSPTVDATHSGSAHLALGSTGSTAAPGNHAHTGYVGELLISDAPSTPLIFADILQNDVQDDLLYSD